MIVCPAEFLAIVRQNSTDGKSMLLIKRQDVIVNQRCGTFRFFTGMKKAKRIRAICINAGVEIDLSHPLQIAHKHRILAQKIAPDGTIPHAFP